MQAIVKYGMQVLLTVSILLAIASCNVANLSKNELLPAVSPLPTPQLPDWIEQISPVGETDVRSQIRIRFKEALIPVESIDSPNQQQILEKLTTFPPLKGQFRFLTPKMVGFQAESALPKATRVRVTLKAGLADLKNHRLEQDLAWTFNTEAIKLTNLPGTSENGEVEPIDINPKLKFTSNVELDLGTLKDRIKLILEGKKQGISFNVAGEDKTEDPQPQEKFDPSTRNWVYTLEPRQTLSKATTYRWEANAGLRPVNGNLSSEMPFVSKVATYAPLAFEKIKFFGQPDSGGSFGRFIKGSAQLQFNNGLVAADSEHITITPAPKKTPRLVQVYEGDKIVNLNPYAIDPATTYTITLGANLKDKFGQTLGKPVTVKYETGDLAGDIWVPSDLNIFPSGKDLQLNISTVNLPESRYKATYQVVQPTDLVYTDSAYPRGEGNDLLPNPASWQSFKVSSKKNQYKDISVPLREKLGAATGMLAYGVQARTNRYQENGKQQWREATNYGLVQLSNLGLFTQWFPDSGMVRVHHLSDGAVVSDATVEIYQSKLEAKNRIQPQPCAKSKTDSTGTVLFNRQDLQQCYSNFEDAPKLLAIARVGNDWAFARSLEYSGAYDYGIDAGWDNGKPESRGVIFSDRQLYQPGEKAWFTGMAYYLQAGNLKQDKNTRYAITLEDPDGKKTDLGSQTTNDFGTFSLELPIKPDRALGYYSIRAKANNGAEISGEFRVAEFKPPNFKVDLALDKEFVAIGDKVQAQAVSNYLFGSPVEGGIQYYVTRRQTDFTPKNWDKFSFGRKWFWPEEAPEITTDVLQANQILNAEGKSSQSIPVAKDVPYPMTYQVDAQVTDVSNLSVADSQTFTVLPSDRLIGLQSNFVADAGKSLPVQVIVTDSAGKVITGQPVRLELQQIIYSSVTQVVEGSQTPKNQVEYKTVETTEIRSTQAPQSVALTAPESGSYRIRANFADAKDDTTATDVQIWAAGDSPVDWGSRYTNNRLELRLDKDTYKPGETATVLIQSPYPEAELHFAIIRHNFIERRIVQVKGAAPQIQFLVTEDMLPNAAVEGVLVRQGEPLSQVEPGKLDKLVRVGFAPFNTNLDDKYLKVQAATNSQTLLPGTEQTVKLEIRDSQNRPIQGQFTVMVVNEAVLQLSGYRPPDLVSTVYAQQAIATRFADNRPDVVLQPLSSPLQKGWGYGGGFSNGAANTRTRKNFQALAYYNGSVLTDDNGQASVTFKLPDDLTTWRVMAVATDGNLHFGNGETTFITTKPLLSNPVLPQFVRPGDYFEGGLLVTNNTGQSTNLSINGSISSGIAFADNSGSLQVPQAESGTRAYRFPMVANTAGTTQVQFTTQLNGASDAFAVPLEVKPLEVTEQVVETGVTNKQVKIPVNIDKNVVNTTGGLEISAASTLIGQITAPAEQVFADDELPFLEPAASRLAIASNLAKLGDSYLQNSEFNLVVQASQALAVLQKLQRTDGGFAAFPKQESSDPFITPYAAQSIAQATAAGFNVNSGLINRLETYLTKILSNPGQYDFCKQQLCKNQVRLEALMGLAALGDKRTDFLADIYESRNQFDAVTQIKLARYLSQFPQWQQEFQTLFSQLQETVYQTGRSATVNLPPGWGWISSPTTAQAQTLRLFIAQNSQPEVLDRLLQGLLAQRRKGTWASTYDNAEALTAVVEYSQIQPKPNMTATVQLAGKQLASTKLAGDRNLEVKVPIANLPRGKHDLILKKSGQGLLHYLVAYRYRLQGKQPGALNGLRVVREIRAANEEKVLQRLGLYAPDEPLKVSSGQVFDIGLEITTDHEVNNVIITDPIPAGFEAVDTSFQTATPYFQATQDSWEIDYQTIYRDRIVAYGNSLQPGVYSLHYLVRSVTPGTFLYPGAEVHLQYAPEEFGRSADSTLQVVND